MYIAGLNFNPSHTQGVEAIVCGTLAFQIIHNVRTLQRQKAISDTKGGKVVKMPNTRLSALSILVHGPAFMLPPVVYLAGTVFNGLYQPAWLEQFRLPYVSVGQEAWARTAACVASLGLTFVTDWIFATLGSNWHVVGVREKPTIVATGPYTFVRHPIYTTVLVQLPLWGVAFWSWIPFACAGLCAAAFAVKMPIEENLLLEDPAVGPDYALYKSKVRSRVIPYIW